MWDSIFSCDSKNLVSCKSEERVCCVGSSDHTCRLWDLRSNRVIRHYTGHEKTVACVALYERFSPVCSNKQPKTAYRNRRHRYSSRSHCSLSPSSPAIPLLPSPYHAETPPFAPTNSDTAATITPFPHFYHVNIVRFRGYRFLDRF